MFKICPPIKDTPCELLNHVRAQPRLGAVPLSSLIHLHCFPTKPAAHIVPTVNFKIRFKKKVSYHVLMLLNNGELLSQFRMILAKVPSSCCDDRPVACAWLFPKAGVDHA